MPNKSLQRTLVPRAAELKRSVQEMIKEPRIVSHVTQIGKSRTTTLKNPSRKQ